MAGLIALTFRPESAANIPQHSIMLVHEDALDHTVGVLQGHTEELSFLIFSQDNSILASAAGTTVILWNPVDCTKMKELDCGKDLRLPTDVIMTGVWNPEFIHSVAFNRTNTELVAAMITSWMCWDLLNDVPLYVIQNKSHCFGINFCCNDTHVLYVSPEGFLSVYGGHQKQDCRKLHHKKIYSFALSPDEGTVAAGTSEWPLGYDIEACIVFIDVASGAELKSLIGLEEEVKSLSFSADGSLLVSSCANQTLQVWSVADGRLLFTYNLFHAAVDLVFNASGKYVIGHYSELSFLFDVYRREIVRKWSPCEIFSVARSQVVLM
jgi:WD40 repeat protein